MEDVGMMYVRDFGSGEVVALIIEDEWHDLEPFDRNQPVRIEHEDGTVVAHIVGDQWYGSWDDPDDDHSDDEWYWQ